MSKKSAYYVIRVESDELEFPLYVSPNRPYRMNGELYFSLVDHPEEARRYSSVNRALRVLEILSSPRHLSNLNGGNFDTISVEMVEEET